MNSSWQSACLFNRDAVGIGRIFVFKHAFDQHIGLGLQVGLFHKLLLRFAAQFVFYQAYPLALVVADN